MHTVKLDRDMAAAPHIGFKLIPEYSPAAIGISRML